LPPGGFSETPTRSEQPAISIAMAAAPIPQCARQRSWRSTAGASRSGAGVVRRLKMTD
jgi:hypothetical protein